MNLRFSVGFLILASALGGAGATAQPAPGGTAWAYTLLTESTLINDCPPCGRPTIPLPLHGTFMLALVEEHPLFNRYELRDINFATEANPDAAYRITGSGTFQIGGEVALQQEMELHLYVDNGQTNEFLFFTNSIKTLDKAWPVMDINVDETPGFFARVYRLHLIAAPQKEIGPLQEIWFSTANGMTSGNRTSPSNRIEAGDLISYSGRVVKTARELLQNLRLKAGAVEPGIDALDIGAGGEILFSLNEDAQSETLGQIYHGDLLSNRGRIVKRNADLMQDFGFMPIAPDVGLDAVQVKDDGEILFSITTSIFSERKGVFLSKGDLLSDKGDIIRTGQQLLARFHPDATGDDYGLDALYVWPSGEIWFSTEIGFNDTQIGPVMAGDLLSDQGRTVLRNLDLVSAFVPLEDLADFGLDGLFIVTDLAAASTAPSFTEIRHVSSNGGINLRWEGAGRVFQLEKAEHAAGPYYSWSAFVPELSWIDPGATPAGSKSFYRVRQW